jgi:HD superfamily phosphohydrolase
LEAILAEIIVGDAFGVDRMDYLLRDSYHAGVAYGRFDHYRLIDTMRILPKVAVRQTPQLEEPKGERPTGEALPEAGTLTGSTRDDESTLGIAEGGLHSAEALLWARYFMYSQLYFHPVRRVYDIHLKDFLRQWLPNGSFSTDLEDHLRITDNEVWSAVLAAARDSTASGHDPARRIVQREHFRILYQRNPDDITINPEAAEAVYKAACLRYSDTDVQYDRYREKKRAIEFPVLTRDNRTVSCLSLSETLKQVPVVAIDYVFAEPSKCKDAVQWLQKELPTIIAPKTEEQS